MIRTHGAQIILCYYIGCDVHRPTFLLWTTKSRGPYTLMR
jgi:hypothetical protein